MSRAWSVCSTPGCGTPTERSGKCDGCRLEAEQRRGSSSQRGYGRAHRNRFRAGVLNDPAKQTCQCTPDHPAHLGQPCTARSEHADHWPKSKRELIAEGLDSHDPTYGRGLCGRCHSWSTTQHQPGGWHTR